MKLSMLIVLISALIHVRGFNSTYDRRNKASADQHPARSANNRIVNGRPTDADWYANSAYIFYKHYVNGDTATEPLLLKCSGLLIAPTWVLTVAHCFDKVIKEKKKKDGTTLSWHVYQNMGWVRVGSAKGGPQHDYTFVIGDILTVIVSGSYRQGAGSNDVGVALVELDGGIPLRSHPEPMTIDNTLDPHEEVDGQVEACWAVGFGLTSLEDSDTITSKTDPPRDLYRYPLTVGTWKHCERLQRQLDGAARSYDRQLVCGREESSGQPGAACAGDGGGALVCDRKLAGLLVGRRETGKCGGGPNAFSVFVYVGHADVYNWIRTVVGERDMPPMSAGRLMVKSKDDDEGSVDDDGTAEATTTANEATALLIAAVVLAVITL